MGSLGRTLKEYGVAIVVAAFVALFVRQFLFSLYSVPSDAMTPTLLPGDLILVSSSSYGVRMPWEDEPSTFVSLPRVGDIVVQGLPGDTSNLAVKRVVGLPGDRVGVREGRVLLNGTELEWRSGEGECGEEVHPTAGAYTICLNAPLIADIEEVTVPPGQVFLVGDQRRRGVSRLPSGLSPISAIQGRAFRIWVSLNPEANGPRVRWNRSFKRVM